MSPSRTEQKKDRHRGRTGTEALWNFWLGGKQGLPSGRIWAANAVKASLKIVEVYGEKPTVLCPVEEYSTLKDVQEADRYNARMFKEREQSRAQNPMSLPSCGECDAHEIVCKLCSRTQIDSTA